MILARNTMPLSCRLVSIYHYKARHCDDNHVTVVVELANDLEGVYSQ
jgi:hypothetical protein